MRKSTMRPVLRYHGGKFLLAPWIISHFPPHRIYCEPFGGAASVLMRKPRAYADVYNDLDSDIVNVFRVLRDEKLAARLCRQIKLTPYARSEFKSAYGDAECPVERARRIIAISFMGFSSAAHTRQHRTGFRGTAMRNGTTPAMDWANWPTAIDFFTERLRGVTIENQNAFQLIPRHDSERTLYYVDPPYPLETRGKSNQRQKHYSHELNTADHERLAALLHSLKGMVVLSSYPSPLYQRLYGERWRPITRKAFADGAREKTEVLWLNRAAHRALQTFAKTKAGGRTSSAPKVTTTSFKRASLPDGDCL